MKEVLFGLYHAGAGVKVQGRCGGLLRRQVVTTVANCVSEPLNKIMLTAHGRSLRFAAQVRTVGLCKPPGRVIWKWRMSM